MPPRDATGSADAAGDAPAADAAGAVVTADLTQRLQRLHRNDVTPVEILTSTASAADQLHAVGAIATRSIGGLTLASLTPAQIHTLATAAGVLQVRTPVDLRKGLLDMPPHLAKGPVGSENRPTENRSGGAGIKVGIIDLFDPTVLASQITAGEIGPVPNSQRACWWLGQPCTFGTPGFTHGNAVAEVVSEGADLSTLYLAEVGTLTDYMLAIDWFAANGVTILNHSAVGPYDGPGDGTGPTAAVVDYAVSKGIAWFNAAGNAGRDLTYVKFSGGYFRSKWNDANNNRWMNWYGTDESLSIYCGALMGVRWSDWAADRTDYDLYISDYRYTAKTNGTKVLASAVNQSTGAAPIEGNDMRWLCNTNPADGPVYDTDKDGFVSLWLYRTTRNTATPVGDMIEVMVNQGFVEYPSNAYSASIPFGDSRNPGAASIGASYWNFAALYNFSSRGPTNDGRAKPDFTSIGSLTTSLGNFTGTSASSPVAAGIAAFGSSYFRLSTPALLMSWLRSISVSKLGQPVKNNDEGWGDIVYPTGFSGIYGARGYQPTTPHRVLDTRGVNGQPLGAPIGLRAPDSITTVHLASVGSGVTVALNVALVNASSNGYLQVYPTGYAAPGATSNINVTAGQTRANFVLVTSGDNGNVSFYTSGGGHIIADVVGAFGSPITDPYGASLRTVQPYTAYDTQSTTGPLAAGTFVDVDLAGTHAAFDPTVGVPAMDATVAPQAVVISVTVSGGTGGRGYLSVVQPNTTTFSVSNLNFDPGESLTTTTFIPVSASTNGKARIFVSRSANVRVDVLGYFQADPSGMGGWYMGVGPERVLDTRSGPKPVAGASVAVPVAGSHGIPPEGASAVFVNSTSAQSVGTGSIATGAEADDGHFISTSIPIAGPPVAAGTLARLTQDGQLRLHTTASTHLIADVAGWFTGPDVPLTSGRTTVLENPATAAPLNDVVISDDGQTIAYVEDQATLHVWNPTVGEVRSFYNVGGIRDLRLSGDGSTLAFSAPWGPGLQVFSYRVADGTLHQESDINTDPALRIDGLSDDGHLLTYRTTTAITVADTDTLADVYLHNLVTGGTQLITGSATAGDTVTASALTGDGTTVLFANGYPSRHLTRYNVNTGIPSARSPASDWWVGLEITDISDNGQVFALNNYGEGYIVDLDAVPYLRLPAAGEWTPDGRHGTATIDGAGHHATMVVNFETLLGHNGPYGPGDALVFDVPSGGAHKISRTSSGALANARVVDTALSDDGNWAVFITNATNTTTTSTSGPCIYLIDLRP